MTTPIPENEQERLEALYSCEILDTAPESNYDNITRLLCDLIGVPWGFVALVDHDRQWFKSHQGIDIEQTERRTAFAAHCILQNHPLIVPDATEEARFAENPSVTGAPFIRFYAGVPLILDGKYCIGALCVAGPTARGASESDVRLLENFASIVVDELELRRAMRRLSERKDRLQLADRMSSIGQLAAGIAHEINSPLQFVTGNLEFLAESTQQIAAALEALETLDEKRRTSARGGADEGLDIERVLRTHSVPYYLSEASVALEQSRQGLKRITELVEALRSYSHAGSKEKQGGSLNEILRAAVTITASEWKKSATVAFDLDDAVPKILCHSGQLNQVFVNLIVNAVHSIEERMGRMPSIPGMIKLRSCLADGFCVVEVEDNGAGIPYAQKAKIFEPYYTTKEHGRGSGQGLAISYDIVVRGHSGHLKMESHPHLLKTVFSVWVPNIPEAAGDVMDASTKETALEAERQTVHPLVSV